jgi:hypothetical protein
MAIMRITTEKQSKAWAKPGQRWVEEESRDIGYSIVTIRGDVNSRQIIG